jgi:hypothetical protein
MHALIDAKVTLFDEITGDAPMKGAWWADGVAVLAEGADAWPRRWDILRRVGYRIPLEQLLTMDHPLSKGVIVRPGMTVRQRGKYTQTSGGEFSEVEQLFYPQSMALLLYLAEVKGPAFVGKIGKVLSHKLSEPRAVQQVFDEIVALEPDFLKWLDQRLATGRL